MSEVFIVIRRGANRKRFGKNLATIIDVDRMGQLQARTGSDERVQIAHWAAVFPDEGMKVIYAI